MPIPMQLCLNYCFNLYDCFIFLIILSLDVLVLSSCAIFFADLSQVDGLFDRMGYDVPSSMHPKL